MQLVQQPCSALSSQLNCTWIAIGKGSLSKVFRGTYMGCEVAVKSYIEREGDEKSAKQHLLEEATILSKLQHQNIIYSYGATILTDPHGADHDVLVLAWADGGVLRDALHGKPAHPYTFLQRLNIASDIMLAIQYLHTRAPPVLHCDLKTANILLDSTKLQGKLADFSEACYETVDTVISPPTNLRLLTPRYQLAPETREVGCTRAGDIYGYGTLLFELFTQPAQIAFAGLQQLDLLERKRIGLTPSNMNSEIAQLILDTTNFDPKQRPSPSTILLRLESIRRVNNSTALQ